MKAELAQERLNKLRKETQDNPDGEPTLLFWNDPDELPECLFNDGDVVLCPYLEEARCHDMVADEILLDYLVSSVSEIEPLMIIDAGSSGDVCFRCGPNHLNRVKSELQEWKTVAKLN